MPESFVEQTLHALLAQCKASSNAQPIAMLSHTAV